MAIHGKRVINDVSGAAERGADKRKRSGAPSVHEHFRWGDLPRDIFCHLASMLLLPEYLQLRLVSRSLRQYVDDIGPVSTASCAVVDLKSDWRPTLRRSADWYSTLRLTGSLKDPQTEIPHLAEGIASGKWTILDLLESDGEAQLALLQQLEQRLPKIRDLPKIGDPARRLLYLYQSTGALGRDGWHETSDDDATHLIQVLQKMQASGQLSLSRLALEGFKPWQEDLLKVGDLEELTLSERWPHAVLGDALKIPRVARAFAALTGASKLKHLTVELGCEEDVDALVVACERKQVEVLDVAFTDIGVRAIAKLLALPLRKAKLSQYVPATSQQMRALLLGIENSTSLEEVFIKSLCVETHLGFLLACSQKPKLKKLSSFNPYFEFAAGREGLCCTRLDLKMSTASRILDALPNGLGSVTRLKLDGDEWTQAKIPVSDWRSFSSLEELVVEVRHPIVFPWECLSLPHLSMLEIYGDGEVDFGSGIGARPACSQLKRLSLHVKPSGFNEMRALLACCPRLEQLYCACRAKDAYTAVYLTIAALELPALKHLTLYLESCVLAQALEKIFESNPLKPGVEVQFFGTYDEDDEEFDQPEDIEYATAVFKSYLETKAAVLQPDLPPGLALPASAEMESDHFDMELPESADWL